MRIGHIALTLPLLVVALAPVAACDMDPVHSELVNQLGPEAPSIPKGPYHRAGQPCVLCHGDEGPASEKFALAGTVFYGPNTTGIGLIGACGVTVYIEDDTGAMVNVTTNCVGNFWLSAAQYPLSFPLLVTIAGTPTGSTNSGEQKMVSFISREPSCGMCHQVQSGLSTQPNQIVNYYETPGTIYVTADDPTFKGDPSCPVQPPIPLGLAPVQP
jgi:hypothetical protein